jgi:PAS domain S-box-containing protein
MIQILVVEDEYVIATNLQENLESLGYCVLDIASSAIEAIEKAVELRPDLVLMDIRLQGEMDGIQAAEQIWNRLQIPVIYITGHSDKSTLDRAKVTFPFGYILKPVKGKELYVAIETALSRYEREQFFSTVLRRIGDGVIVVDAQCRVKYLNRVAEVLTGWQQDEATNQDLMTVLNLIDEETRRSIANPVITAFQQDSIVYLSHRVLLITKDGTSFPVSDSVASLKDNKGNLTGAVLVFRDDTQRRLQEEHRLTLQRAQVLERQMEDLQRLNQLKDDFLSTVSHELRTPLSNIKMAIRMLEIALDQQGDDAENNPTFSRVTRYLEILRDQCNQELNLVNDLLELQQLEAGARPLDWGSILLNEWILEKIEVFQERARSRELKLQANIPGDLPVLVSDITILTRIVAESLMNACKYTPPGGEIMVTVRTQPEDYIQIIVGNTSAEIPENELTHIFDRFYRIPTSDRWQQGGTGLGLALVKKSIDYLGGSIEAENSAGQMRLIIELPLSPPGTSQA